MSTLFVVAVVVCPLQMGVQPSEVDLANQEWPNGCYQITSEERYTNDFTCFQQSQLFVMQAGKNVHHEGRLITKNKIKPGYKVSKFGCLQEKRIRFDDVEA